MSLKGSRLRVGSSHGGDYDDGDHQSSPQIRSRLQGLQLRFLMGAERPFPPHLVSVREKLCCDLIAYSLGDYV
ncbi:hypothetical protein BHE74_00050195 [Ensete ventricosum]|nr:hypothetical protein BHE74_00050195 [Ensete ventricosum]